MSTDNKSIWTRQFGNPTRWGVLIFVAAPALSLAVASRIIDPNLWSTTGTGTAWYARRAEIQFWVFAAAFAWVPLSLFIVAVSRMLRHRRPLA